MTRRDFVAVGIVAIISLAGCGGSITLTPSTSPKRFSARRPGTVLSATQEEFDNVAVRYLLGNQPLVVKIDGMEGNLRFRINDSLPTGPTVNAGNTEVSPGDIISWEKV